MPANGKPSSSGSGAPASEGAEVGEEKSMSRETVSPKESQTCSMELHAMLVTVEWITAASLHSSLHMRQNCSHQRWRHPASSSSLTSAE
jgi:hypothetical protein